MNSFSSLLTVAALTLAATTISSSARAQEAPAACQTILSAYEQVEELYERGDFEAAAALLQAATSLCPQEPMLQYNLGRTLERRSQQLLDEGDAEGSRARAERAHEAYEAFLATGQGEPQVLARAAARRDALALQLAPAPTAPAVLPTEVDASQTEGIQPLPWVFAAVGVAALGVSAGLGVHALDLNNAANVAPTQQETLARLPEAQDFATATNATLIVGATLVVAGTIWGLVDLLTRPASRARSSQPFVLHF